MKTRTEYLFPRSNRGFKDLGGLHCHFVQRRVRRDEKSNHVRARFPFLGNETTHPTALCRTEPVAITSKATPIVLIHDFYFQLLL
jgi:hypothetical protein